MFRFFIFSVLISLVFFAGLSLAGIPKMINYQGMLTDNSGNPLSGSYNLTFQIWTDTTGGSSLWNETQNGVQVQNGLFNVILGKVTALNLPFDQQYWLEVQVGAETMPRIRFTSVGYAYRAQVADSAVVTTSGGGWTDDGAMVRLTTSTDNVGIGTSTPSEKLHVEGTARMTGFKMSTGAGNGYVLTSDASGVGTWQAGGSADKDWVFRVTDGADTTLTTGGQWGIARYGNTLYGNADSTHVNLGVKSTTGTNGQNYKYCTVGGGYTNTASGPYATVGGGVENTASGSRATVGGGYWNTASGTSATVGGGDLNTASGWYATAGGGEDNTASGSRATVGGGYGNTASWSYATVGGGYGNTASGGAATVGGGLSNTASGEDATIGGGYLNAASGWYATVGGGYADTAVGDYSFAAGNQVKITWAGDYTFAFGNNFTTSASHAVVFHDASTPIKVGIGTTSPAYTLDVNGDARMGLIRGEAGGNGAHLATRSGGNAFSINWTGSELRFYIEDSHVKTFVIDHPLDQSKYLVHGTLEGAEAAVYYRGTAQLTSGIAEITLPSYFETLVRKEGRTILLTNIDGFDRLAVKKVDGEKIRDGRFVIVSDNPNSSQEFDWEVKAIRQDVPLLVVEPDKKDIEVRGDGPYTYPVSKK